MAISILVSANLHLNVDYAQLGSHLSFAYLSGNYMNTGSNSGTGRVEGVGKALGWVMGVACALWCRRLVAIHRRAMYRASRDSWTGLHHTYSRNMEWKLNDEQPNCVTWNELQTTTNKYCKYTEMRAVQNVNPSSVSHFELSPSDTQSSPLHRYVSPTPASTSLPYSPAHPAP